MDGEAGTTVADRSTAAVGVANEGGEPPLADQQDGATSDGTTDDQTSSGAGAGTSNGSAPQEAPGAPDEKQVTTITTDPAATLEAPAVSAVTDGGVDSGPTDIDSADHAETRSTGGADGAGQSEKTSTGTTGKAEAEAVAGAEGSTEPKAPAHPTDPERAAGKNGGRVTAAKKPATAAHGTPPELHSGHKLARRYQLAECVTRIDGFSSWRAVDEKLRRAVGIHILPADHPRARPVLAAARSAALLGDPRFVQVLDAVEENDLVYVIHEWLPDATSLADLFGAGPMEPHEAYQMVSQVSQGMAAAHREGLAHLRLDPGAVLRTVSGQYRIRGLAVAAALRGLSSDRPQREDTAAIGSLLYAALTQRWPYEEDAHGLTGLPKGVGPVAPDQVRAGVHRGLSEIAMRALVNEGATASRQDPPCTTPEELAKAVAGIPRIRPPEHAPPVYPVAAFRQPPTPPRGSTRQVQSSPAPPPTLPGRTGKALKWAVSALLVVAIGLGSWQLADALKSREDQSTGTPPSGQKAGQDPTHPAVKPITIVGAKDFDPFGDGVESPNDVAKAYDHDPGTYWQTSWYSRADLGGLKSGVGVVVDLGRARHVGSVKIDFIGADTAVQLMAASQATSTMPTALEGYTKVASGSGAQALLSPAGNVTSRYLLVWLTRLPATDDGHFRGKISEISVTG